MNMKKQLLELEEQFWKGDAEFYRQNLTENSLMVFAEPVGVLTKDRVIETIAASPRWTDVEFEDFRMVQLTDDTAVVTYKASAYREMEKSRYSALASSVYANQEGSWKLAFHQQTPGAWT